MSNDKSSEKAVKKSNKKSGKSSWFGILGIAMALVFVSIAYSTSVIFFGTTTLNAKIMLAPQALFALGLLFGAFYKLFKD